MSVADSKDGHDHFFDEGGQEDEGLDGVEVADDEFIDARDEGDLEGFDEGVIEAFVFDSVVGSFLVEALGADSVVSVE